MPKQQVSWKSGKMPECQPDIADNTGPFHLESWMTQH